MKLPTLLIRFTACCMLALMLMGAPVLTYAHGGDDHDHPAAVVTTPMAPRAAAQSEDFELLMVLEGRSLLLYLDQFSSNEPVPHAILELTMLKNFKASAKEIGDGVYSIALPEGVLVQPGKYPLEVSVQVGEVGDILTSTLELPVSSASEVTPYGQRFSGKWWIAAASLGALSGAFALLWRQRRHKLGTTIGELGVMK